MENSRFATLPAELRNQIWELALMHQEHIALETSPDDRLRLSPQQRSDYPLAITWTCRQIRSECGPLFYRCNIFDIREAGRTLTVESLRHFAAVIGKDAFSLIPRFTFTTTFEWYQRNINNIMKHFERFWKVATAYGLQDFRLGIACGRYHIELAATQHNKTCVEAYKVLEKAMENAGNDFEELGLKRLQGHLPEIKHKLALACSAD